MKWPSVYKLKFPNANNKLLLRIEVNTQVFCGKRFKEEMENVPLNKEYSIKDRLQGKVDRQAKSHVKDCSKCQTYHVKGGSHYK